MKALNIIGRCIGFMAAWTIGIARFDKVAVSNAMAARKEWAV